MTRHLLIFLGTFLLGAVAALALRTARHPAPPGPDAPPAGGAYAPLVSPGPATPAPTSATPATAATATAPGAPVNSVCAICGMKVDPRLPTLEYRGQRIGFGCKLCPPKFQAEPDKYGPYYLRNAVIPR